MDTFEVQDANGNTWTQIRSTKYRNPLIFCNGVLQAPANHRASGYTIVTEERRMHGARYYTAAPLDAHREWPAMMEWVVNTFGPTAKDGVWTPGQRWYANNAKFWFRNEPDLLLFLLRWQGQ